MKWTGRKVLVTGGLSFIGSHLAQALLHRGAAVRVVDDCSSGKLSNLAQEINEGMIELVAGDLKEQGIARGAVEGQEIVFHLAAEHGGRGYVDTHQAACASNMALDGVFFLACRDAQVAKVVYASSGCVYPNYRQTDPRELLYLTEDMAGPPYDADNLYGWAKLMGEMTLRAYCKEWGMRGASCRYFTVYGERGKEDHAIIAMIARAFIKQCPLEVWGTGEQVRNWTHVSDIVEGTILAAEKLDDGRAINLGTRERVRVIDAVREVMRYTRHDGPLKFRPLDPTGPYNRVADNSLASRLLGWEPKMKFTDGLHRTIDWYFRTHSPKEVEARLETALVER
jgi:nucleoside-diphosphate-sugar epimerase